MPAAPLLQVHNLSQVQRVRGEHAPHLLFAALTFTLEAGERLALLAPARSAVSAAARAIAFLDPPAGGTVSFEGEDLARLRGGRLRALRRRLQYVGGSPRLSLSPRLPVARLLAEPLQVHRLGRPVEQRAQVAAAAAGWQLNAQVLDAHTHSLSPALCQRVALARAGLLQPKLLVADCLTEWLEPAAARPLLALLADFSRDNRMACLLATTDAAVASAFAGRVIPLPSP